MKAKVILLILAASVASVLLAAALPETILAGDAEAYRDRMTTMFSGKVPYLEFDFEHLPGVILPLAATWLLGGRESLQSFAIALAAISTVLLVASAVLLVDLEHDLDRGLTIRWAAAVVPLLPFLLFRNDSFSVLLVIAAFWLAIRSQSRNRGTALAWLGVASKLWPGAWAVVEWWRGKRLRALITLLLTLAALAVLRTPAVLAIQRPIGVHTETLAGSLLALSRYYSGLPLHLHRTSALYIEAPWWTHMINVVPAVVIVWVSLTVLTRPFTWAQAWLLFGVLTGALMMASPLFSTQYMAWITPFASGRRRTWIICVIVNLLSLAVIVNWNRGLDGAGWWFLLAFGRNLVFVGLTVAMVIELRNGQPLRLRRLASDENETPARY